MHTLEHLLTRMTFRTYLWACLIVASGVIVGRLAELLLLTLLRLF